MTRKKVGGAPRARDSRGRFITWKKAREGKNADLAKGLPKLARALARESPPHKVADGSVYAIEIRFSREQSWARLIRIFEDADVRKVPRFPRVRYLIAARTEDGEIRALSRAYTSPEIALGEAIQTLEGETVLSPKEDDANVGDLLWSAVVVNGFLRKDAMR